MKQKYLLRYTPIDEVNYWYVATWHSIITQGCLGCKVVSFQTYNNEIEKNEFKKWMKWCLIEMHHLTGVNVCNVERPSFEDYSLLRIIYASIRRFEIASHTFFCTMFLKSYYQFSIANGKSEINTLLVWAVWN